MKPPRALLAASLSSALLLGCREHGDQPPPVVRPVLSIVVEPAIPSRSSFVGVIEPRYQTVRAFQVLGRIVARNVNVGDPVRKGQTIAQNDPLVYQLAVRAAEAELTAAESQYEKSAAQLGRTSTLFDKGVVGQADLDVAHRSAEAAASAVKQAEARLAKAKEQLSYTTLTSDIDGVVASIDAEVGQMASPGMKIMALARTDVREAVVDVPEDIGRSLALGTSFEITLQAEPAIATQGKVREIAPQADAATRLKRIKITLGPSADAFRLGATVTATLQGAAGPPSVDIPLTSLFARDGADRVWVVDPEAKVVRSVAVSVAARNEQAARIVDGLKAGARVVVAGANSLAEGQAVTVKEEEAR